MPIQHVLTLLDFCLKNTMGSPISPSVANLFMEEFESKAISTTPNPPRLWPHNVDNIGVVFCHPRGKT